MISARRFGAAVLSGMLLALAFILGAAAPASAHSQVIASSPADGQRIEVSPKQLTFVFSEPSDVNSIVVSLTGPSGPMNVLGKPTEQGVNDVGHQTIVVPVNAELPAGLYRETISATSRIDGHTAGSELIFGVRTDVTTPAGDSGNTTSPIDRVRSILQGVMLIAAGLAFGLIALSGPARGRGLAAGRIASAVAALASVGAGAIWHVGNGLIVAGAGVIGALILFAAAFMPTLTDRARVWVGLVGLAIAVVPLSLVGHAAAQGTLMAAFDGLHIITTATWAGAVIAAAFLLPKAGRGDRLPIIRRTSLLASVTFLVSLITGLLMANGLVPSVGGLFGSLYGLGLVAKSVLVIPILLLAIWARVRLNNGKSSSLVVEAGLLFVVLSLGVLVASQPPPAAAKFLPTPSWEPDTAAAALDADDLLVSVQIQPNTPGTRFLVVRVDNTRRPAPGPITDVKARFGNSSLLDLKQGSDGLWTTNIDVNEPGPTAIHVEVSRPLLPLAVANNTWTVAPTPGTYEGGAPLTGYVGAAIGGLVGLTLIGVLAEGVVRRRRDDEPEGTETASDPGAHSSVPV